MMRHTFKSEIKLRVVTTVQYSLLTTSLSSTNSHEYLTKTTIVCEILFKCLLISLIGAIPTELHVATVVEVKL